MTRKIIKREMQEGTDGEIYEVSHFEDTFEINEDEEIIKKTFRILRTPYRNQEVEVADDTKSLIEKIANGISKWKDTK